MPTYRFMLTMVIIALVACIPMSVIRADTQPPPEFPSSTLTSQPGGCPQPRFSPAPGSSINAGLLPYGMTVNDFNLDHKPDIAVINNDIDIGSGTLLLGDGQGSVLSSLSFPSGIRSRDLTSADFNLDGKPDLAATSDSIYVRILLGRGDGSFDWVNVETSLASSSAAVGDFNRDGKPDLAVTHDGGQNRMTILLGNGQGGFTASPLSLEGNTTSVATADFNKDDKLDLIVINVSTHKVLVLLGNGDGSFAAPYAITSGDSNLEKEPRSVAIGDFNGDRNPDIVTANVGSQSLNVLLGNGQGQFTASILTGVISHNSIATGDYNQDDNTDLAVVDGVANQVSVLLGRGDGTFMPPAAFDTGFGPSALTIGDLNLDQKPDLIVANRYSHDVTIHVGNGQGDFSGSPIVINRPAHVVSGDFNLDGKADVVVDTLSSALPIFFLSNRNGGFGKPIVAPVEFGGNLDGAVTADFNQDGKIDMAIPNSLAAYIMILFGKGDGGFNTSSVNTPGHPTDLAVTDFNSDGKSDLIALHPNSKKITILLGDGNGGFPTSVIHTMEDTPAAFALGDFNLDQKPDVAIAQSRSQTVTIQYGDGVSGFSSSADVFLGHGVFSLKVGDFNQDGNPDLVILRNSLGSDFIVLLNRGDGSFERTTISLTNSIKAIVIEDFNQDKKPDVAVIETPLRSVWPPFDTITIFVGDGEGGFPTSFPIRTGFQPESMTVADFNQDSQLDIAVANSYSSHVSILLNTCASSGHIKGQVVLQGRTDHKNIRIVAGDIETLTNEDGSFLLAVPPGLYTVTASHDLYLPSQTLLSMTANALVPLSPATLLGGDIDDNRKIGLSDLVRLAINYGTQPPLDSRADIDASGRVDLADLMLIAGNYGRSGFQLWAPVSD